MHRLIKRTKPSCLTNIVVSVCLMTLSLPANGITLNVEGNCIFETDVNKTSTPWVIVGDPVSEKAVPSTIIWNVTTKNILSSISSNHPHTKYLTGLRYTTYYVYRASDNFPTFVDIENSVEITRSVTFTCSNNGEIKVDFRFPLEDVNEAPEFLQIPNKDLSATSDSADIINENEPIVVVEKDFTSAYNDVQFTTDRPDLILIESSEDTDYKEIGRKLNIKLRLNLTDGNKSPGRYSLNLFASDNEFTTSANIKILVSNEQE